jgi:hypothetical protein
MSNAPHLPPPYVERGAADVQGWLDDVAGVRATPEQIAKMSPAQKLDYCRRFDQATMPAWSDPRK